LGGLFDIPVLLSSRHTDLLVSPFVRERWDGKFTLFNLRVVHKCKKVMMAVTYGGSHGLEHLFLVDEWDNL